MSDPLANRKPLKKGLFDNLRYDLPSGLVVFLVAIPLCLGIALASQSKDITDPALNVPLSAGLLAGMIGGLIIPLVSRSALSVSGPAAGLISIVLGALLTLGSFQAFLLALLISGVLQIILGFFKAGTLAYFFPNSVIRGMLAAIGIILILKQIPHALGFDHDFEGEMSFFQPDGENTFSEILQALTHVSLGATIITFVSLAILIVWQMIPFLKKLFFIPAGLVVVVMGALINYIYQASDSSLYLSNTENVMHMVNLPVFDSFSEMGAMFTFPDWSAISRPDVWVIALTLAVVSSMESLLSVEAVDKLDPYKRESPLNRELIAQGLGNTIAGLIGALPVTAVIVRSSANVASGGRTPLSAWFHGLLLALAVFFFASIMNLIPLSSLAAILLLVGYKLASPKIFRQMYSKGWNQFIPFLVTVLAVVFTDMLTGILIGLAVGGLFVIRSNFIKALRVRKFGGAYYLVFQKDVFFFNKATIKNILNRIPEGSRLIIDARQADFVDSDVREILKEYAESASLRRMEVQLIWKGEELPERKESTATQEADPVGV